MLNPFYLLIHKLYIISWDRWVPGVGDSSDSSDSVIIVIISVTITTVIAKNYYRDSGHVVTGMCIWHCLVSTYPQPREKNVKMHGKDIIIYIDEIDLDKELESDVWEYLVSLLQVENA